MNILMAKRRLANLVKRFTQGRRRCGGIEFGGGGGLSFRDADVVPFTFDLDFLEGLSCRESTVDESNNSNNNKLYLHDHNQVLQYCKSYWKLLIDSLQIKYLK